MELLIAIIVGAYLGSKLDLIANKIEVLANDKLK